MKNWKKMSWRAGIVAAIFTFTIVLNLFLLSFAKAQEEKPKQEAVKEEETRKEYEIETMTVTAEKRKENIQDVPVSISALSDIQIEDAGIVGIEDVIYQIPNLHMMKTGSHGSQSTLFMRGIMSIGEPTVGFYVDDVNFPLHYMYNTELLDLERVEVLRGPQGTLYGRNSESGVINLVTKQPDNEFRAKVLSEYGSYNSWRFGANVSGPIAKDKLYLGVAMQYKLSDGYIENKFNDDDESAEKDHKNGRATLRWTPTSQWDISFIADAMDTDDQQNSYRYRTGPFATDYYDISHNITDEYSKQEANGQTLRLKYKGLS